MRKLIVPQILMFVVLSSLIAVQVYASNLAELKATGGYEVEDLQILGVDWLGILYNIPVNTEGYRLSREEYKRSSEIRRSQKIPFRVVKGESLFQVLDRLKDATHGLWDWRAVNEQVCVVRRPYPEVSQTPDSEDVMAQTIDCSIVQESIWDALKKVANAVNTSPQAIRPFVVQPVYTSNPECPRPADAFTAKGAITLEVKGESVRDAVTKILRLSNLPIRYMYVPGTADATHIPNFLIVGTKPTPDREKPLSVEEREFWETEMNGFSETFKASHPKHR